MSNPAPPQKLEHWKEVRAYLNRSTEEQELPPHPSHKAISPAEIQMVALVEPGPGASPSMLPSTAEQRLEKELLDFESDPIHTCSASPKTTSNIFVWDAHILGPTCSPYAAGVFNLDLVFPPEYPIKPPTVEFTTKVYHPNIDMDGGFIELDIMNIIWTPAMSIKTILSSVYELLASPGVVGAVEPGIAYEYYKERDGYNEKAKMWTLEFAHEHLFS